MQADSLRTRTIPLVLLFGDLLAAFAGLCAGFWLRYHSPVGLLGIEVVDARFGDYALLLVIGTVLLAASFGQLGVYDDRLILRRYQSLRLILRGLFLWLLVYLGLSLVLKFEPPISRLFVVVAFLCAGLFIAAWREGMHFLMIRSSLRDRLRQNTAVLGWSPRAARLVAEIGRTNTHPMRIVGRIGDAAAADAATPLLGASSALGDILLEHRISVLVLASEPPHEELRTIMAACERAYCDWKLIPASRDVLLSALRLETVGSVPLLGGGTPAVQFLFNRLAKRAVDVAGALAGLLLSAPLVALLALWIRRGSAGPVFFGQQRVGAQHRTFTMWKLRTMREDAPLQDALLQSTPAGDPRVTPEGRFLRRWNLDELPQFWNVLRGDMSLVGPRPERPVHVDRSAFRIAHYLPRHLVRPGMTGWAQVSGLRGDTSLEARVEHDLYYIENWSLWFDLQILALTLLRWRNPAE